MAEFDLEKFYLETLKEFNLLQQREELQADILKSSEVGSKKQFDSWISKFFFNIAVRLGNSGFQKLENNPKNIELRKMSIFLLEQDKIQKTLCSAFFQIIEKEEISNEQLIRTIVSLLGEKSLREDFSIPLKPKLFAFISIELLEMDIKTYCSFNQQG